MSRLREPTTDLYVIWFIVYKKDTAQRIFDRVKREHPELEFIDPAPQVSHVGKGFAVKTYNRYTAVHGNKSDVHRKWVHEIAELDLVADKFHVTKIEVPDDQGTA